MAIGRSHGPERFWGDFYIRLVQALKSSNGWFATAAQVVSWFRKRRGVCFERLGAASSVRTSCRYTGQAALPPLILRVYRPSIGGNSAQPSAAFPYIDIPWNANTVVEFDSSLDKAAEFPVELPATELCSPL